MINQGNQFIGQDVKISTSQLMRVFLSDRDTSIRSDGTWSDSYGTYRITGILAKPKSFKPVLHLYEMINVSSGSILPFSKIKAKFSTVNHHNSHKFPQFPTNFSCCGGKKTQVTSISSSVRDQLGQNAKWWSMDMYISCHPALLRQTTGITNRNLKHSWNDCMVHTI